MSELSELPDPFPRLAPLWATPEERASWQKLSAAFLSLYPGPRSGPLSELFRQLELTELALKAVLFYDWAKIEIRHSRPLLKSSYSEGDRQLIKLAKMCDELVEHIKSLEVVLFYIEDRSGWTLPMKRSVPRPSKVADQLSKLSKVVSSELSASHPKTPRARGRPRKEGEFRIAQRAADLYEEITTRRIRILRRNNKAGGPFIEFLAEVYAALGSDASPEAQARAVLGERRKMNRR